MILKITVFETEGERLLCNVMKQTQGGRCFPRNRANSFRDSPSLSQELMSLAPVCLSLQVAIVD